MQDCLVFRGVYVKAVRRYSVTLQIRERMILHAKAIGILEKDGGGILESVCDGSPGYWTLTGVSGDSTLARDGDCVPLVGNDVPSL